MHNGSKVAHVIMTDNSHTGVFVNLALFKETVDAMDAWGITVTLILEYMY